jgi:excisionase family DNA binding protein
MNDTNFLTVAEVAKKLRLSPRTVRGLCERGVLGSTQPGRKYLIPSESLDEYLKIRR